MNIAIDIDDTITNTYETIIPMISLYYNKDLNKLLQNKPSYNSLYNLPNFMDFVHKYFETIARIAPLKENVVDTLQKLKKEGHNIIFVTSRNNEFFNDAYKTCQDFFKENNIPFDKLITNASNKAEVCLKEHIDLFIDDNTKHCLAVSKKGIPTLQFITNFAGNSKLNKVSSWQDVYQKVQNMYI